MRFPVIDLSTIHRHKQSLSPEMMRDLVQTYIDDTRISIQEVDRLFGSNAIVQLGHEGALMQADAINLGTARIAESAHNLQKVCEKNDIDAIPGIVSKLKNAVDLALGELHTLQL